MRFDTIVTKNVNRYTNAIILNEYYVRKIRYD